MTHSPEQTLFQLILESDRKKATRFVDEWAKTHGYDQAIKGVLEPALSLFGERWARADDVSLAQGYMAGKIAEDVMVKAVAEKGREDKGEGRNISVVMGNIEDDFHALGRKMVSIFLRSAGFTVHDLGNDVLPEEFVDRAQETGSKVIGASAMMYSTAMNICGLREEIDKRGLTGMISLAVGGAVFNLRPALVGEVGGEGSASNAIEAVRLIEGMSDGKRGEV